jgi:hypothetical protein
VPAQLVKMKATQARPEFLKRDCFVRLIGQENPVEMERWFARYKRRPRL